MPAVIPDNISALLQDFEDKVQGVSDATGAKGEADSAEQRAIQAAQDAGSARARAIAEANASYDALIGALGKQKVDAAGSEPSPAAG
jgi:hypothetical protein